MGLEGAKSAAQVSKLGTNHSKVQRKNFSSGKKPRLAILPTKMFL
jgi:hypothetical protein